MTSLDGFRQALKAHLHKVPAPRTKERLNEDLRGVESYPPANADQIADQCAVIALVRNTRGQVDQPTWYHSLSVIGTCEGGDRIAHEWSSGHPTYSEAETAKKLAQAMAYPPTTCVKLHDCQSALCEKCPQWGKIGSPIRLGFAQATITAPASPPEDARQAAEEAARPLFELPERFSYTQVGGKYILFQSVKSKDGEWSNVPFCATLHYPIKLIYAEDGIKLEMEAYLPRGGTRRFILAGSLIGAGGAALAAELGKNGVVSHQGQKMKEEGYLTALYNKMKADAMAVVSYHRFGWYEDSFLVGQTMIRPTGNVDALCHGNAQAKMFAFTPRGDYAVWKQVIDTAYNHEGQEALQYLVILGFAAPLFSLFKESGGVTVYSHSQGSGVGKTTAQRAALSAWGDWQQLQLSEGKTTNNALWGLVGTYCNLPVVYDELTNMTNEDASKVVHSVAAGSHPERLGPDGSLRLNGGSWSTILLASGNNLITEKFQRNNSEAEQARTFEFTVPNNTRISPNEARELFPQLLCHYGHAGIRFMEYVVRNREAVIAMMRAFQTKYNDATQIAQVERYHSQLQACALTALHLCRELGILNFPIKPLWNWIKERTTEVRVQRAMSIGGPLETFGVMLTELWQGVLVTKGEGDIRRHLIPQIIQDPNGRNLVGRKIFAADKTEKDVLFLSCAAVNKWCNRQGASGKELHAAVVAQGWADQNLKLFSLGKGVPKYVGSNVKCWVVNSEKVDAESHTHPVAQRLTLMMKPGDSNERNAASAVDG
jgi:hypothetical protein